MTICSRNTACMWATWYARSWQPLRLQWITHHRCRLLIAGFRALCGPPRGLPVGCMDGPRTKRAVPRWRRFVLRLHERALWAAKGVFLWLLQRPYLRSLPFPYPSTSTTEAWLEQTKNMVKKKLINLRQLEMSWSMDRFTMSNLGECIHLRNRVGIKVAFCEDPILEGLLLGQGTRGLAAKIRKAAHEEAVEAASKLKTKNQREAEARSLIGPKGGLPSLRTDLVRLASLLHVEVGPQDTIPQIKEKVKPIVDVLKDQKPPPTAAKSAAAKPKGARPKAVAMSYSLTAEDRPLSVMSERVDAMAQNIAMLQAQLRAAQEERMVALMEIDVKSESEEEYTHEQRMEFAASLESAQEDQLMAHYGPDLTGLTMEQREAILDP